MSKRVIDLEDARAMKAMGAPLNTPVVDGGQLPKRCEKMIADVLKVAHRCRLAAYAFIENQNASTYAKLKRTHSKLAREMAKIPLPNWIDTADGGKQLTNPEEAVASVIVGPRCFTAFMKWAEIITELENGNDMQLTISSAADVWPTET